MKLREALLIGLELIDGGALILQTLLKRLRWRILKPQHVVFLFPARELFTKFRIVQKRQIVFKPLLLQFGRLVPNKTPAPGGLSEDSRLLPGRHQFELVGDVGFRDLNPTPSFSRTHTSHELVRRGFERLSSRQLKPRVFSARLYKGCLMLDNVSAER